MIKLKKNKVTTLKIMPSKVSSLPVSQINSGNSNGGTGGGSNNAANVGGTGTVNGSTWISAQMYFPWAIPVIPSAEPEKKSEKSSDGRDGLDCKKCSIFFEFVEVNQEDGTFICFKCRNGY